MSSIVCRYRLAILQNPRLYPKFLSFRSFASQSDKKQQQQLLLEEASALSRSLYRRCFRSIRHIRHGNDHDEQEFQRREQDRLEKLDDPSTRDPRLSMLSMLPPVNRPDELRSRAEYYQQYTRENFVQESDCLDHAVLTEQHVDRFMYLLRQGDHSRTWLLKDMKFEDPCDDQDLAAIQQEMKVFDAKARSMTVQSLGATAVPLLADHAEDDELWDDEGDEGDSPGLPEWYKNPRR